MSNTTSTTNTKHLVLYRAHRVVPEPSPWLMDDDATSKFGYYNGQTTGVHLFINEANIVISEIKQQVICPKGKAAGEVWERARKAEKLIISFKKGRVNLYHRYAATRKRKKHVPVCLLNVTNAPGDGRYMLSHLDFTPCPATQGSVMDKKQALAILRNNMRRLMGEQGIECWMPKEGDLSFQEIIFTAAYPVLGQLVGEGWGLDRTNVLPPFISSVLRGNNFREVAIRAFGKKLGTKAVGKAVQASMTLHGEAVEETFVRTDAFSDDPNPIIQQVRRPAQVNLDNLALAIIAKKLVTVDDLQTILRWKGALGVNRLVGNGTNMDNWKHDLEQARKFLACFERPRVLRFLKEVLDGGAEMWTQLIDTARIIRHNGHRLVMPNRVRGLKELHDDLARQQRRLNNPDFVIPVGQDLATFEGAQVGDMTLQLARTNYQVVEWGETLNHCIASYANDAGRGDCLLLGLYRGEKLVYNLMLNRNRSDVFVEQFYGHCNQLPTTEDQAAWDRFFRTNRKFHQAVSESLMDARKQEKQGQFAQFRPHEVFANEFDLLEDDLAPAAPPQRPLHPAWGRVVLDRVAVEA
jgi:hypothetical protein